MRPSRYSRQEKVIGSSDSGAVRCRWRYGHLLLCDEDRVSPDGNLRNKIIAELIEIAKREGYTISRREIQYRLQCAKAYRTEAELRNAIAQYKTWFSLTQAGFPPVEKPKEGTPEAELYDPRWNAEAESDDRRAARSVNEQMFGQLELLPGFYPDMTIGEAWKRLDERRELTARRRREDDTLAALLQELADAVSGDESATLSEAADILYGDESEPENDTGEI